MYLVQGLRRQPWQILNAPATSGGRVRSWAGSADPTAHCGAAPRAHGFGAEDRTETVTRTRVVVASSYRRRSVRMPW
jgi:hypothetical protein